MASVSKKLLFMSVCALGHGCMSFLGRRGVHCDPSCFGESFGLGDPTGMGALSNCFPIMISDWQPVSTSGFWVWRDNGFWAR